MYPPVPVIVRECAKDVTVGGYNLHPGVRTQHGWERCTEALTPNCHRPAALLVFTPRQMRMYCSAYASFRNPQFFKDPDTFIVDRFVASAGEAGADAESGNSDMAKLVSAFGGGHRVCVGQRYMLRSPAADPRAQVSLTCRTLAFVFNGATGSHGWR